MRKCKFCCCLRSKREHQTFPGDTTYCTTTQQLLVKGLYSHSSRKKNTMLDARLNLKARLIFQFGLSVIVICYWIVTAGNKLSQNSELWHQKYNLVLKTKPNLRKERLTLEHWKVSVWSCQKFVLAL